MANATRQLEGADRGLAHAIASETLRRLPDLDALIDSATAQPLPGDAKARGVLRIALTQALVLETPPHAAIATALTLISGGPKRLVHGVFGTLMRRGVKLPAAPTLPAAAVGRWGAAWGYAMLARASEAMAVPPPLDVTLRDASDDGALGGEGLMPGHRRLPRGTNVPDLPGFADGKWWVQNISASIPARLLGPGGGRAALDLCAAPGGKTMQLASALAGAGNRTRASCSEKRTATRLRENLRAHEACQAEIVTCRRHAPGIYLPHRKSDVDASRCAMQLPPAPCARHPDILRRPLGAKNIAAFNQVLQARICCAHSAARLVDRKRHADLCATCSLQPAGRRCGWSSKAAFRSIRSKQQNCPERHAFGAATIWLRSAAR